MSMFTKALITANVLALAATAYLATDGFPIFAAFGREAIRVMGSN